jgi:hypothetical protein
MARCEIFIAVDMEYGTAVAGMAIALQTSEDFRLRLNEVLRQAGYDIDNMRYPEGYQEAPLAYDAVWAVALGEAYACLHISFFLSVL